MVSLVQLTPKKMVFNSLKKPIRTETDGELTVTLTQVAKDVPSPTLQERMDSKLVETICQLLPQHLPHQHL